MRALLLTVASTVALFSAACATTAAHETPPLDQGGDDPEAVIISAHLIAVSAALAEFKKVQPKWTCFDAHVFREEEGFMVSFMAKDDIIQTPIETVINASDCGLGANYVVSANGRIIRMFYTK